MATSSVLISCAVLALLTARCLCIRDSVDLRTDQKGVVEKPGAGIVSLGRHLLDAPCTSKDISISQSKDSSFSGIPRYIVQITNLCTNPGCAPRDIHLGCGWFASASQVIPQIFRRLSYDDCLVNDGKPLKGSEIISFTYSNTNMYPMTLKQAKFC